MCIGTLANSSPSSDALPAVSLHSRKRAPVEVLERHRCVQAGKGRRVQADLIVLRVIDGVTCGTESRNWIRIATLHRTGPDQAANVDVAVKLIVGAIGGRRQVGADA